MTNTHQIADLFSLHGKKVLITDASTGLGRHFAQVLGKAGAEIIVTARRAEKLSELVDELHAEGIQAHAIRMDVTQARSVKQAFDFIDETGDPARIVIHSTGTTVTQSQLHQTEEDWDSELNTHLQDGWLVAQEAAARMVAAQRTGSIIQIASILDECSAGGIVPYSMSKAALTQATKAMALELAQYGICVNTLLPGYIQTDLNAEFLASETGEHLRSRIPSRRFGLPEHLNGPLLLLASEAGRHITGETLAVDGGHLMSSL